MSSKKYPSKYSNGKDVSAAQYITELICEKKAKINKKDLHYKFWLNKEWAVFYRNQIGSANKLLKKYSDTAIIRGLNNSGADKIYSLRAPHLLPIIEQEEQKLAAQNTKITKNLERPDNIVFGHKKTNNKNIFSKLKDIDDEC
jgi:hypothetical protein